MIKVNDFRRYKYALTGKLKFIFFVLALFTFHLSLFTFAANAQTDEPKDAEPPPLKAISKEEKTLLEAQTELTKRTDLSLKLMETRLKKAENFGAERAFGEMFTELGGFHALIDNTLNFLRRNDNGKKIVLSNYKKMELNLRAYLSRLEVIRRDLPIRYEFYVRGLVKTVREARTRAVEPLFSDSVVPDK